MAGAKELEMENGQREKFKRSMTDKPFISF